MPEDLTDGPSASGVRPVGRSTDVTTCPECSCEVTLGSVLCHRCGTRVDSVGRVDESANSESTINCVFVRIHHWTGINLLGVLVLLLAAFALRGAIVVTGDFDSNAVRTAVFIGFLLLPAGLDVLWRTLRGGGSGAARFFMPFEGGAFMYLPIWLMVPFCVKNSRASVTRNPTYLFCCTRSSAPIASRVSGTCGAPSARESSNDSASGTRLRSSAATARDALRRSGRGSKTGGG